MNSVQYLYAAYIATWTIHAFYIGSLVRRYRRLRREKVELSRDETALKGRGF